MPKMRLSHSLFLLLYFCCLAVKNDCVQIEPCKGQWNYPADCVGRDCEYKATWEYVESSDDIKFAISTRNRYQWTGIGFSHDRRMTNTDAIVGWIEPGDRYVMMDAWLSAYAQPNPDIKQSIFNISATANSGFITFKFSRKRQTGDLNNDVQFVDNKCIYFVFPVRGGPVDLAKRNIKKHLRTPVFSSEPICVQSCDVKNPITTTTTATAMTPSPTTSTPTTASTTTSTSSISPQNVSSAKEDTPTTGKPILATTNKPSTTSVSSGVNNREISTTQSITRAPVEVTEKAEVAKKVTTETNLEITKSTPSSAVNDNEPRPKHNEPEEEIACKGQWMYPPNCAGYGCDYKAVWEYIDGSDEIMFAISTKNRNKWTGIGFSGNQAMPDSDAILGLVEESGRFFLMDTWLRAYEPPPLDQQQNIHNMSAWRENGITTLKFHRKRLTGDSKDFQFSDENCPYLIFPVQGGVFNAVNKRIRKHDMTPIITEKRVCIKSCKKATTTQPSVTEAPPVSLTSETVTKESRQPPGQDGDSRQRIPTSTSTSGVKDGDNEDEDTEEDNDKGGYEALEETKYSVEFKLPRAWKATFGKRQSPEYNDFMKTVRNQLKEELQRIYPDIKSVEVMELTGVEEEANSVIARVNLVVLEKSMSNASDDNRVVDGGVSASLTSALFSAIQDEVIGTLPVDAKYLVINRADNNVDGNKRGETVQVEPSQGFFNDDQIKWAVIALGVAALIILVLIQASCMIWRDRKNKERRPSKDKQMVANGNWKDSSTTASSAYSYENFAVTDDPDGGHYSFNKTAANGHNNTNGKTRHSHSNNHSKHSKHKDSGNNHHHHSDYNSATLERTNSSSHAHRNGYSNSSHNPYATQDRRYGAEPSHHSSRHYLHPSFSQPLPSQLQPDFYFMPHQRRYSGEIVKVFVDYNNPQFLPK